MSIDVMLTNRSRNFSKDKHWQDSHVISDFFRSCFQSLPTKNIQCRNYKKFNPIELFYDLEQELLKGK